MCDACTTASATKDNAKVVQGQPSHLRQVKCGFLLRYRKSVFSTLNPFSLSHGGKWREQWVVLYENSYLIWYKESSNGYIAEGGVMLNECPHLIACGLWTLRIPCGRARPILPTGCHTRQLISVAAKQQNGSGGKLGRKLFWFLCKSQEEVNEWMTAISNTLPPPIMTPSNTHDVISTPARLKKLAANGQLNDYQQYLLQQPPLALDNYNGAATLGKTGKKPEDKGLPTTLMLSTMAGCYGGTYYWGGWGWGPGWITAPSNWGTGGLSGATSWSGYDKLGGDYLYPSGTDRVMNVTGTSQGHDCDFDGVDASFGGGGGAMDSSLVDTFSSCDFGF